MIVLVLLSLGSIAWAWILYRRSTSEDRFERWTLTLLPPLGLALLLEMVGGVLLSPTLIWNDVRISRSVALLHGLTIYPARDALGPVIGTLHAPVSHCFYLLGAWLSTPTSLIVGNSALSILVVFAALGWALRRAGDRAALPFLFCSFLILQMPGTYSNVLLVHTDAAALAFTTLACGILGGKNAGFMRTQLWIAGSACALVMGCKQTLAPLSLGLLAFIVLAGNRRDAMRNVIHFVGALIATGVAVLVAIAAFVPFSAFLFNTVVLAAHRPWKPDYMATFVPAMRMARLEALPAVFPIAVLLIDQWMFRKQNGGVKRIIDENRWLAFVFAGIFLIPVCAKATVTVGGDVNHMGLALYPLFAGAALAIQRNLYAVRQFPRVTARMFAALGIVASIAPAGGIHIPDRIKHVRENVSEAAFHYVARHGNETYFPRNPLASLLTSGKLYHFDVAVYDREIGGAPLSAKQMESGLPEGFMRIALPPEQTVISETLAHVVVGWTVATDPELPGWTIYERKH